MSTANQVVTNSFHGLCFAIIFHRPFVVYCPPEKSPTRQLNLLTRVGLENRLVRSLDQLDDVFNVEINWAEVDSRLEKERAQSLAFLECALCDTKEQSFEK
jgi:hypothetical protein